MEQLKMEWRREAGQEAPVVRLPAIRSYLRAGFFPAPEQMEREETEQRWSADTVFVAQENASQVVLTSDRETVDAYGSERTVLLFDMTTEAGEDRALWHGVRYQDLALTPCEPRILECTEDSITVTADAFTPFALIDAGVPLSDNCFPLKAGEIRTVKICR